MNEYYSEMRGLNGFTIHNDDNLVTPIIFVNKLSTKTQTYIKSALVWMIYEATVAWVLHLNNFISALNPLLLQ